MRTVDESAMARAVIADLARGWGRAWQRVADFQTNNPGVKGAASAGTADPVEAINEIVPRLALLMHPQMVAHAVAFCDAVVGELGKVSEVRGTTPKVTNDGDEEASEVDRLAELEAENALLRYKMAYYERALEAARVALESAALLATAAS